MKNVVIIAVLMMAMCTNVFGQQFGIKAGLNLNRIDGDEVSYTANSVDGDYTESLNFTYLPGFYGGISFEYEFNKNLGFTTGLYFAQKGTKAIAEMKRNEQDGADSYSSVLKGVSRYKTNYIELPLSFKAGFGNGYTKVYGMIGGAAALAISGTLEYTEKAEYKEVDHGVTTESSESWSESEELEFSFDDSKEFNSLNIGLIPGIGVEFGNFQIEATYNVGLNHMAGESRGNTFNLSLGYRFGDQWIWPE